jgi:hypothetical protein
MQQLCRDVGTLYAINTLSPCIAPCGSQQVMADACWLHVADAVCATLRQVCSGKALQQHTWVVRWVMAHSCQQWSAGVVCGLPMHWADVNSAAMAVISLFASSCAFASIADVCLVLHAVLYRVCPGYLLQDCMQGCCVCLHAMLAVLWHV